MVKWKVVQIILIIQNLIIIYLSVNRWSLILIKDAFFVKLLMIMNGINWIIQLKIVFYLNHI